MRKDAGAFHGIPMSRLIGYGAGGLGLGLLENAYVGGNLPPELKTVNLGVGAATGAMLASHDPAMQTAALTTIPLKQMGLFGIGGLDRFRRSQQALTDTNLSTARLNQSAARINARNAGGNRALGASFLVPALLGGGGAAALAYMQYQKQHKPTRKYETVSEDGTKKPSQKIRIDIPPSAFPKEFYDRIGLLDKYPKSHTRLQKLKERRPDLTDERMQSLFKSSALKPDNKADLDAFYKWASSHPVMDLLKGIAWQSTGIPNGLSAFRETGAAANSAMQGDNHDAGRYAVSGAANAALALLSLRFGAPLALKLFGRQRIAGVLRNAAAGRSNQLTELPTAAGFINRWGGGHELGPATFSKGIANPGFTTGAAVNAPDRLYMTGAQRMQRRQSMGMRTDSPLARALALRGRVDPQRYSFTNPTSSNPLFRAFGTDMQPKSLPGHIVNLGRYGVNRGFNAAYQAKQFAVRHPFATSFTALPAIGSMGVAHDDMQRHQEAAKPHPWFADYSNNTPSNFMPMSTISSNLIGAFGGGSPMDPLRRQIAQ